ncbi:hypothetical protein ACFQ36_13925 [Arthrobacter sp. GCM10027362]|uniref:hypothetical protein n=1 Tax=Arthrobacter sp. GCM10027362 TaxID=3273379 RepID=UPI00362C1D98
MRRFPAATGIILALTAGSFFGGTGHFAKASGSPEKPSWSRSLDSTSSAQPTPASPRVRDTAQTFLRTPSSSAKADATATSSADCDGCAGEATTVQVVYYDARKGSATADNIASAWATSCADCSASAVSVQVVVAPRRESVTVNNRAIAVNASCASCSTSAAALQFVFAGGPRRELSSAARDLVAQIKAELADRLESAAEKSDARQARARAKAATEDAAARLERIIAKDLGGGAVERFLDVEVGS